MCSNNKHLIDSWPIAPQKLGPFLILAKTCCQRHGGYETGQNQRQISNELLDIISETVLEKVDSRSRSTTYILLVKVVKKMNAVSPT